ncbi:MFS transporter [Pseudomonas syringae]|uniref:MFS transporter n=1 Tax=Pseudomonas syringae TaxID=317 RepID=UPI00215A624E|nr:MFS transporter [Pseudomonas syringae]MCR8718353.1 MFS transporter [Pseudomonas syringae]
MVAALMGSTLSSPLYPLYQSQWSLTSLWVNALFAAYAVGVVFSLTMMTRFGDRLKDRRIAIAVALFLIILGAVVMAFAPSATVLMAGRIVAGLGTGTLLGSASAALLELHPKGDVRMTALQSTIAFTLGSAGGPLLSGYFIHINLWPEHAPYLVIMALAVISMLGALSTPLPVARKPNDLLQSRTHKRPTNDQSFLIIATLTLVFGWCIGSVFMVSGPKVALELAGVSSTFVAASLIGGFQLSAGLGQLLGRSLYQSTAVMAGTLIALISHIGMGLFAISGMTLLFEISCVTAGLGYGISFVGATGLINRISRPEERVRLISMYYVTGYLFGNAAPTVIFGACIDAFGLKNTVLGLIVVVVIIGIYIVVKLRETAPLAKSGAQ